ncbi:hypothetical protein G5V65_00125 [Rhodobacter sp. HX-7-19]|uniref:DUF7931 domain-containing protein n=1 Tax=Paragemmobacter kunshanensis TaxID=2583234 RepID=A0A6M1TVN7_9RHOB|nr:hypothetical protein [Rhodobacter kunshanensis]NGQ89284.1 hypothetical protein [Rhodobacter kunshanensis]
MISVADGSIALNGSTSHAAVVLERMLSRGQDSVRIMTRYLDPRIYADSATVLAAADFLRGGKKLRILVDQVSPEKEAEVFERLADEGDIQIKQVPEAFRNGIAINFSLMDQKGFRLEKDESGATAVVSFGQNDLNERLMTLFDKVWKTSTPVLLRAKVN